MRRANRQDNPDCVAQALQMRDIGEVIGGIIQEVLQQAMMERMMTEMDELANGEF